MSGISPEILRHVKRIELRTRGLVNSRFTGEYHSVFKGQGMEFSEVREYQPGDEVRTIDWNVSARMRRLFVKRYVEERELTVLLVVDCSGSSRFGTGERDKQSLAAELAAVLALTATRNNDRVGLILCSDRVEHVVPPRKGRRHALRLVRDVLAWPTTDRGTDLGLRVHQRRDHLTGAMIRLQQLTRIAHDDADLADARGGDGLEAVVQDRLVRDGHQLLGPRVRDGTEPRAAAARKDECLQCLLLM